MNAADPTRLLLKRNEIAREIWANLPIWFVYLEAVSILNFIMANTPAEQFVKAGISRHWFALTALPPLLWFYAYYRKRLQHTTKPIDKARVHRWLLQVTFGVPVAIWALYTILPFLRLELHADWMRRLFEFMQLGWVVVFVAHTLYFGGLARFSTFFIVAWFYGLMLENAGIIMGYFFEPNYLFYLGRLPAPFATMMGWSLVFYTCTWIATYFRQYSDRLQNSVVLTSLFTTAIALSVDAQLDPLASLSKYFWEWNSILPNWWLNVPFCNYAAWFGAFMAFSLVYYYFLDQGHLTIWQKNTKIFLYTPMICLLAGVFWMSLMVIYEGGFDGPIFQILDQFYDRLMPY